jgi:hypothetical protein
MELNKRKSLLTPAVPTVWGMIHGDISKQQDIVDMISEKLEEIAGTELLNKIKNDILAEINPVLNEALEQKQPILVAGENIKTLKGRSLMGEGDLDPLDTSDRDMLNTIDLKADKTSTYSKKEVDELVANVEIDDSKLATKEELQSLRDSEVQGALMKSDSAYNIALSTDTKVTNLQTYVDEQIGGINTITEDILG